MTMKDKAETTWTRFEQKLWIATMFTGCATVYAARTAVPLCIVAISKEMNWDKKQSGSVLSAFYWGYTMTQVLGGYLSDKVGGDTVLALTATAWSLLTFWTPFVVDYYPDRESLLAECIIQLFPVYFLVIYQRMTEPSVFLLLFLEHTGTIISGSLGSYLLYRFGWRCVFYTTGSFGMVWVLFLRYYLISKQRRKDDMLSSLQEVKPIQSGSSRKEPVPWLILFKSPALWAVLAAHFGHAWGFNVLVNWLPTYFHETFPQGKGWVFNVVPWLLAIPTGFIAGWISDAMTAKGIQVTIVRKIVTTMAMLGVSSFVFLVCHTSDYHTALFLMTMALTCNAFHTSAVCVIPQDIAPKYSGSVYGIMNTAGSVTGFVGVYIAGHVLEVTKNWNLVFNQTIEVICVGWVIFMIFGTGKRIV